MNRGANALNLVERDRGYALGMLKIYPVCLALICLSGVVHAQTTTTIPTRTIIPGAASPLNTIPPSASPLTSPPLSASPLTNPPLSANPLQPTTRAASPGPCSASAQSLCTNGLGSCNAQCAATVAAAASVGVAASVATCTDRCCNQFNICLHQRQCPGSAVNCFAPATFAPAPAGTEP
jgi:hypothetical protein